MAIIEICTQPWQLLSTAAQIPPGSVRFRGDKSFASATYTLGMVLAFIGTLHDLTGGRLLAFVGFPMGTIHNTKLRGS